MTQEKPAKTLAEWKEDVRNTLGWFYQRHDPARIEARNGEPIKVELTEEMYADLKKRGLRTKDGRHLRITTVFDPVVVELEDRYGGKLTCKYEISRTLHGFRKYLQQLETYSDDEIADFAEREGIAVDKAMAMIATRYVEAETFAVLKVGRLIHKELKSVLQESIDMLIDVGFLKISAEEYGLEVVDPEKTLKELANVHLVKPFKRRSGVVRRGARKGSKQVVMPMSKLQFYKELQSFVSSYEHTQGKRPTAPEAARALGFGSEKTMRRRRQGWGDTRKWLELINDILLK